MEKGEGGAVRPGCGAEAGKSSPGHGYSCSNPCGPLCSPAREVSGRTRCKNRAELGCEMTRLPVSYSSSFFLRASYGAEDS